MIKFCKARSPRETLSDLDEYLNDIGDEPVKWLAREVKSWGEFSYAELEAAIADGRLNELIDWQERYAKVVNEHFRPLWLAAIAHAAYKESRGRITISDSDISVRDWLMNHGGRLITQLSEESRKAVMTIILDAQQTHNFDAKKIAHDIRPLIGLTSRQVEANAKYRQKIFDQYVEHGASAKVAAQRAEKAALKYASKQHRYRAETIVHTELAFAYNQGAHVGVLQAINAGFMGRCAMIWTTAGTNRVCPRCLALKGTVVGHTNESGVTLPPIHPRCRCTIEYREIEPPKVLTTTTGNGNVTPMAPLMGATAAEVVSNSSTDATDFVFDLQRFGVYEDQVESHGGSGNIKPDKIIEGHERTPRQTEPLNIIDHKDHTGQIDKRIFYGADGQPYFEINTTNHNQPKWHPYGTHGEHAHDITWTEGKAQRVTRELSTQERKDNGDIL